MDSSIMIFVAINVIMALGFYITIATGQVSLGHGAFMGVGAYTSSYLTVELGWPLFIASLVAILTSALAGILIGFPSLRIKGIYLAVATLGFGELVNLTFRNSEWIGGAAGYSGMSGTTILIAMGALLLVLLFILRLDHSRLGRDFRAIHQDELVAQMMGINVLTTKLIAFTISAGITGLGGALYAHYMFFIEPGNFAFHSSMMILFYVLFGGIENPWGAVVGAILLTLLPELLRGLEEWRMVLYGGLVMIMMVIRPQGLITNLTISFIRKQVRK